MEAGKWSWRGPGRSEMRRASMCYRNGKRWRDKAHVKDTGNEKARQYFQALVSGVHKDIAWPWQMELHMLAVKPHQTRLYVQSTCGLRITKSRQFGRNRVSMFKVSAGFMGFRSVTGRTTRSSLMYWTVAYIGPSATLYSFGIALWDLESNKAEMSGPGLSHLESFLICLTRSVMGTYSPWTHRWPCLPLWKTTNSTVAQLCRPHSVMQLAYRYRWSLHRCGRR